MERFRQRKRQWQRRACLWQDYLRAYGKLLADADGAEEFSGGGQRHERSAEDRFFSNAGEGFLEQHRADQGRLGRGSTEAEERARTGHGDSGKRQYRVAISAAKSDRRIPGRAEPHSSWQGPDHVRGRQGQAEPEADEITHLRQWYRFHVLPANRLKEQFEAWTEEERIKRHGAAHEYHRIHQ